MELLNYDPICGWRLEALIKIKDIFLWAKTILLKSQVQGMLLQKKVQEMLERSTGNVCGQANGYHQNSTGNGPAT